MKIWWNHWFSTAYHLINLMKNDNTDITIIGTNLNPDCVYKMVCDEFYKEPSFRSTDEYLKYCLSFCQEHSIDVFVPRHNLTQIIKHKSEFEEIGTKVLANTDYESVIITDDKIKTYQHLISKGMQDVIPEFYVCKNAVDFSEAFNKLNSNGYKVCFKLSIDEGAITYHVIDKDRKSSIYKYSSASHLNYEEAYQMINSYSFKIPLIVMPYMNEPEISVDCLLVENELITIPRYKLGGRVSKVSFNTEIIRITKTIEKQFQFEMPFNVQYRILDEKPMLLEINPRMSGGVQLSCKATGINIPRLALHKLLGQKLEWNYPSVSDIKVAHVETPIIIR